jgi:FkbM family methyltransferase
MSILSKNIVQILPPNEKLAIVDCGAMGASEAERWKELGDRVIIYGFDPISAECERLNALARSAGLPHTYFPFCLAGNDSPSRDFNVTKHVGSYSLYPSLSEAQLARWKGLSHLGEIGCTRDALTTAKIVQVPTISLNTWSEKYGIRDIDFIKLDIQGAELEVLQGGQNILSTVLGLEVEVEFTPLYKNQPLFADVDIFLRQNHFTFFNLHFTHIGHFVGRTASPVTIAHPGDQTIPRQIKGQLVTADARYLLDPIDPEYRGVSVFSTVKLLNLACVAEICGKVEYAFEVVAWLSDLLRQRGDLAKANILQEIIVQSTQSYQALG